MVSTAPAPVRLESMDAETLAHDLEMAAHVWADKAELKDVMREAARRLRGGAVE